MMTSIVAFGFSLVAASVLASGQELTKEAKIERILDPSPDCGAPAGKTLLRPTATPSLWSCLPPYETPVYTKPADDSIVFGSLLEAAGLSDAANKDWVGAAAGNFCGGPEKQLILMTNSDSVFYELTGPTPDSQVRIHWDGVVSGPWRAVSAGKLGHLLP